MNITVAVKRQFNLWSPPSTFGSAGPYPARLQSWAIGGIEPSDLSAVRSTGAAGAAISSALYRDGAVEKNFRTFADAWIAKPQELRS